LLKWLALAALMGGSSALPAAAATPPRAPETTAALRALPQAGDPQAISTIFTMDPIPPTPGPIHASLTIHNEIDTPVALTGEIGFANGWQLLQGSTTFNDVVPVGQSVTHTYQLLTTGLPCETLTLIMLELASPLVEMGYPHVYREERTSYYNCQPGPPAVVQRDYGDLPDGSVPHVPPFVYPTRLVDDGARHIVRLAQAQQPSGLPWLGGPLDKPDEDPDGQPELVAIGDDQDGNDDEGGVKVKPNTVLAACAWGILKVPVMGAGVLNAWIDADNDGDWSRTDEHFIVDKSLPGGPQEHQFWVPCDASGDTFFRFRYSTHAGLQPTGEASDGEVEDHQFEVEPYTPPQCPAKQQSDDLVIMIPGYAGIKSPGRTGCEDLFGRLKHDFVSWGWDPDNLVTVSIYEGSSGCDEDLEAYPTGIQDEADRHTVPDSFGEGANHSLTWGHTRDTPIPHLAWHLTQFLAEKYPGRQLDVITHSMGGVVIRYAMAQMAMDRLKVPPSSKWPDANIEDVFTAGGPHAGFGFGGPQGEIGLELGCGTLIDDTQQCRDMQRGSDMMILLRGPYGIYPQSVRAGCGGSGQAPCTQWTLAGSMWDPILPPVAAGMSTTPGHHKVIFGTPNHDIFHWSGEQPLPPDPHPQVMPPPPEAPRMYYFGDSSACYDHETIWSTVCADTGTGDPWRDYRCVQNRHPDQRPPRLIRRADLSCHWIRQPHVNWYANLAVTGPDW
jgi:hypothetical protein